MKYVSVDDDQTVGKTNVVATFKQSAASLPTPKTPRPGRALAYLVSEVTRLDPDYLEDACGLDLPTRSNIELHTREVNIENLV